MFFITLIFCFYICKAQNEDSIKFKAVGWTLAMPIDANELDRAIFQGIKDGIQYSDTIDYRPILQPQVYAPLFSINKETEIMGSHNNKLTYNNGFWATISKMDYNTWQASYTSLKKIQNNWISEMENRGNIIHYDTTSLIENIDGLIFQKFYIKSIDKSGKSPTDYNYWYYTYQNNYELQIYINYFDEKLGEEYLRILKSSKFQKFRHVKAY